MGKTPLAMAVLLAGAIMSASVQAGARQPNVLVIVADDLAFSDLGAFGGEIDTPNLDALAREGVRFTGFHTAPTCSPSRAMLLTGTDSHRAGFGTMAERVAPNQKGRPGYEGYLRPDVVTLAERFAAAGYRTMMAGKWHMGLAPQQDPHARGFQHSFALLQGSHNHYGLDFAADLNKAPEQNTGGAVYTEDGVRLAQLPRGFYSSDFFTSKLLEFLGRRDEGAKPFFAYLAFSAPHWPLQAPREVIEKYKGRYDQGYDRLRESRLARQAGLGLLAPSTQVRPMVMTRRWDELDPEQQRLAARDMEVYAAMVDRLDQNVGRVVSALKRSGELDDTLILFLSDNGPEGRDTATTKEMPASADNRLENRGNATSYFGYGPGWAQAGSAPSWLIKYYATEGGTRNAAFLRYPGLGRSGAVSTAFLSIMDVTPTLLEFAGIPLTDGSFQGRAVEPLRGRSWVPYLKGRREYVYGPDDAIGTEVFGSRSLRQGDWKITDTGNGTWRLFDVARDPGETHDLAAEMPDRLKQLEAAWGSYARDVGVVAPPMAVLPQP
ncbi:Arylsulfatase [Pseudomonas aeruginosa]|nr:Arylsulfatase [Pseudomonas aeruginosa]